MLYGNSDNYPKLSLPKGEAPADAISPRLALAAACADMLLALEWVESAGYVRSDSEDEITPDGLAHTIKRMIVDIDRLLGMECTQRVAEIKAAELKKSGR